MPEVYRCPMESADAAREGKTRYVAPRGPKTVLPRCRAASSIKDITDGTSNTIIFIDGGDDRAVTWTKPDDWDVSPAATDPFRAIFEAHRCRRSTRHDRRHRRWLGAVPHGDDQAGDCSEPC